MSDKLQETLDWLKVQPLQDIELDFWGERFAGTNGDTQKHVLIQESIRKYYLAYFETQYASKKINTPPSFETRSFLEKLVLRPEDETFGESISFIINTHLQKLWAHTEDIVKGTIISWGFLILYLKNGEVLKIDIWEKNLEEIIVKKQTIKEVDALKEMILETSWWVSLGLWITALTARQIQESVQLRTLVQVEVGSEKLFLSVAGNPSDKSKFLQNLFTVLEEEKWVRFNPETRVFEKINTLDSLTFKELRNTLLKISYEEYKATLEKLWVDPKDIVSEAEFKEGKLQGIRQIELLQREFLASRNVDDFKWSALKFIFSENRLGLIAEKVWGRALHFLLFPVFFKAANANPNDLWSVLASFVEMGLFTGWGFLAWSLAWWKLGRMVPTLPGKAIWTVVFWILWGIAGVEGGKWIGKTVFDIDKNFTQKFPDRDTFLKSYFWLNPENKQSVGANVLMTFGMYQFLVDTFWVDWLSIWYPYSIDLSTDPMAYMAETYSRDFSFWNGRVDDLKTFLKPNLEDLYKKGFKKQVYISWGRGSGRWEMRDINIEEALKPLLFSADKEGKNTPRFQKELYKRILSIVSWTQKQIQAGKKVDSDTEIQLILSLVEKLRIEFDQNRYLREYGAMVDIEKFWIDSSINGTLENLPVLEPDMIYISKLPPEKKAFVKELYKRMRAWENLIQSPDEKKIFETLMSSNQKVSFEWKGEFIEWDLFYKFFWRMLFNKRKADYLKNVQSIGTPVKRKDEFEDIEDIIPANILHIYKFDDTEKECIRNVFLKYIVSEANKTSLLEEFDALLTKKSLDITVGSEKIKAFLLALKKYPMRMYIWLVTQKEKSSRNYWETKDYQIMQSVEKKVKEY